MMLLIARRRPTTRQQREALAATNLHGCDAENRNAFSVVVPWLGAEGYQTQEKKDLQDGFAVR